MFLALQYLTNRILRIQSEGMTYYKLLNPPPPPSTVCMYSIYS